MTNLPNNWKQSTLAETCQILAGFGFPERLQGKTSGDLPFYKVGDISEAWKRGDTYLTKANHYVSELEAREIRARPLPENSTVFAKIGAAIALNRRAILSQPSLVDNNVMALHPASEALDHKFLFHFICTVKLDELSRATTVPSVRKSDIEQIAIPLPPLAEQRGIVAEIEKQFTRLDAGVAALRRAHASLKRYRAAVLKAACGGRLVPAEGEWPQKQIATVIQMMDQGWSPKCEPEPSGNDATWAVIKTTAIQNLRFLEWENKTLPLTLKPRKHLELAPGDLLVTRAGPRTRVGVACLVKSTRPRLMLCDKAYRLRCKADVTNPKFLELVLNAPHIVDEMNRLKTGISDSGVNLTQKRFGELIVPLPSLDEQAGIVAEVERRLSVVEELEATVVANLQRADGLRQSILYAAFAGSLQSIAWKRI